MGKFHDLEVPHSMIWNFFAASTGVTRHPYSGLLIASMQFHRTDWAPEPSQANLELHLEHVLLS